MRYLLLLLLVISAAASAEGYIATYTVQSGGLKVGTITRDLSIQGNHYQLIVNTESSLPFIKLGGKESSEGKWEQGIPSPKRYSYSYLHKNEIKEKKLIFSPDHLSVENNGVILATPSHIQDKLSYQLLLSHQFSPSKAHYHYSIADGHKLRSYDFNRVGAEIIHTSLGNFKTIILEYDSAKHHIILWIAPKLNNMILKASFETSGKIVVNATLHSYKKKNTI